MVNQAFARIDTATSEHDDIVIVGCCLATKCLNVESDTKCVARQHSANKLHSPGSASLTSAGPSRFTAASSSN